MRAAAKQRPRSLSAGDLGSAALDQPMDYILCAQLQFFQLTNPPPIDSFALLFATQCRIDASMSFDQSKKSGIHR